jgi:hypothetical protein
MFKGYLTRMGTVTQDTKSAVDPGLARKGVRYSTRTGEDIIGDVHLIRSSPALWDVFSRNPYRFARVQAPNRRFAIEAALEEVNSNAEG